MTWQTQSSRRRKARRNDDSADARGTLGDSEDTVIRRPAPLAAADAGAAPLAPELDGSPLRADLARQRSARTRTPPQRARPQGPRRRAPRRLPRPGPPREPAAQARRRRALKHLKTLVVALVLLALFGSGGYVALQSVFFIGTNSRGLVTLFQGVPYQLPGGIDLYSRQYVSGVDASQVAPARRSALLDHHLRSEGDAASRIRSLELEELE